MKKYFKIFFGLLSLSTKRYLENRINSVGILLSSLISLIILIFLVGVMFQYTKKINGWEQNQLLFLLGVSRVVLSLFYMFANRGISFLSEYIKHGDLDLLLTKPINSQFFVSFRLTRPLEFISVLAGFVLIWYVLPTLHISNILLPSILLIFNLICGVIILYSIFFMIATLSIWIINFYSLGNVYYLLTNPLSFPTNIYGPTLSFIFIYILPLGLIISTPVDIFLNYSYVMIIPEILMTSVLFLASIKFWNFALRHYTSASS